MDNAFKAFIEAERQSMCPVFRKAVDEAQTKKSFVDMALTPQGCAWLCERLATGCGLSATYISDNFNTFNNGGYIMQANGYTSSMYCQPSSSDIIINTTLTLIVDYKGRIRLTSPICALYLVNSDVDITGMKTSADVYLYNSRIFNRNIAPINIRHEQRL